MPIELDNQSIPNNLIGTDYRILQLVVFALEEVFHVTKDDLMKKSRLPHIAWPRQVGMAALIDQFGYGSSFAARAFCRKDHGAALHARIAVKRRASKSFYDRRKVQEFLIKLGELRKKHHEYK